MKCAKCGTELTIHNVRTVVAAHDDEMLDVIVECDVCGRKVNDFISINEMIVLEDGKHDNG